MMKACNATNVQRKPAVARKLLAGACATALSLSLATAVPFDTIAPGQFEGGSAYAASVKAVSVTGSIKKAAAVTLKVKSATAVSLQVGKTHKISVKASKGAKVTYSTSKKAVATVSSKGVVTAKKAGSATITVKAKANGKTVSKTVKVTVKAANASKPQRPSSSAKSGTGSSAAKPAPTTPAPTTPTPTTSAPTAPAKKLVSIENATVDAIPAQAYADGNPINPALTVRVGGKVLVKGKDYITYWSNNRYVGTASIRIQGINVAGYSGTKTVTFQIYKPKALKSLSSLSVESIPTQLYTGKPIAPEITIKDGPTTLRKYKDYVPYFSHNIYAGTASVVLKGIDAAGYKDSITLNFKIVKSRLSLGHALVSSVTKQKYTGKAITPSPTVTYAGEKLVKGTDYTLSYRNNVNAGTATITITGCGVYTGTRTVNFTIEKPETITPEPAQPGAYGMNGEEYAVAKDIFNAYNDFRARKGLSRVVWDDGLFTTAFQSSVNCAKLGRLQHGTAIANYGNVKTSDILQYAWKMSGSEAVKRWEGSAGHRRMMQCDTATSAGAGVYNNDGTWYYTIVYNFSGNTNQSGN